MAEEQFGKYTEAVCRRILRPVIRFFLRGSVQFQQFQELARRTYVEIAEEELAKTEKGKVNVSRIALIAGLTRREVHRIYKEGKPPPRSGGVSTLAKVLNRWQQDERFTTKSGSPRVLSYGGEESEFHELVTSVSTAINSGTFLFEVLRSGAAEKSPRGLKLIRLHDSEQGKEEARIDLMADNLQTLIELVIDNIDNPKRYKNLHLRTEYDNISKKELINLRKWMGKEGSTFHNKARAKFSRHDQDVHPDDPNEGGGRVVLTTFSYTTEE